MKKFEDCPCNGANLEKLIQPAILTLLTSEEQHGYSIVQKLQGNSMLQGKKPDPSGVYRYLKQMEQKGLVTAVWDVSNPGAAKRLYQITDDGLECLKTWINTLEDYYRSIGSFLSFAKSTVIDKEQSIPDFLSGKDCCKTGKTILLIDNLKEK